MATDLVPHRGGELEIPQRPQSRQLVQSIHLEEQAASSAMPIALGVLACILILGVGWAALTRVDQVILLPARVLAASPPHVVRDAEGGTVMAVLASRGQRVAAGDPLVRIGAAGDPAEIGELEARRAELALTVERLRALAEGRAPDFDSIQPAQEALRTIQQQLYDAEIEARDSQALVLQARVDEQAAAVEPARDRLESLTRELPLLQQEAEQAAEEAEAGRRSPLDVLIRRREVQQVTDAVAAARNEVLAGQAAIERSSSELQALDAELRRQALERAAAAAAELEAAGTRLARAGERAEGEVLVAPVAGVISRVAVERVNETVLPGDVLFEIMPLDGAVRLEARAYGDDVARLSPDQPVVVRPVGGAGGAAESAGGGLSGAVASIAGDTDIDPVTGQPYYRVGIQLDEMPPAGLAALLPGTAATAGVTIGHPSLLESLLGGGAGLTGFRPATPAGERHWR